MRRSLVYAAGLFLLATGVSFSIAAGFGVSPVSSLAVAVTITTGITVGVTTVLANVLFIVIQMALGKTVTPAGFGMQFLAAFVFGVFIDSTLWVLETVYIPETLFSRSLFLGISLLLIAAGLFSYISAKFPLMPYDAMTQAVSARFFWPFARAKVTSDGINVACAGTLCLAVTQTFGSIGIGTLIAAASVGRLIGLFSRLFQQPLQQWLSAGETIHPNRVP
ncbi:YczE/YyaS/YitT family protein [Alkalicoccus urumqiensis]|uniref:YitT family protein n=1 Tax=Alkalicoccus urumqiensis TaxID=1548213 RepID=A0A2P6MJC5_ALKUR|nr:DUF6198 family protein [Alkalicoccus urumqiensis]PRO66382.1 hypothetical protein C6I21_06000 [Alkalicoccus urumqiensis]